MGPICLPETSVTTNLSCVTSLTGENLIDRSLLHLCSWGKYQRNCFVGSLYLRDSCNQLRVIKTWMLNAADTKARNWTLTGDSSIHLPSCLVFLSIYLTVILFSPYHFPSCGFFMKCLCYTSSILRQLHSLFQRKLSKQYDLILYLSIHSIFPFR
jgi:hypothetical protein